MAEIVLEDVTKRYGEDNVAVRNLDLDIQDGEFMVLVGPSGCGKTTALRMVAGLEAITDGRIRIGDKVVNDVPPKDRDIAMVFQNYALYPHMSVYENMAFGLKLAKEDRAEIDKRVKEAARILGLQEFLDRKPRALSGGQRQRVAMGRAIVRKPQAFLMDEPLSNLDAKLRVQMRSEIARIQNSLNVTTVYVTHDQVEAMTMGDRVAVIRKGELQQVGSPPQLFDHPDNLFVAGFIGSPSMNFVASTLESHDGKLRINIGNQTLTLDEKVKAERPALERYSGREIIVGIRPQDFEDSKLEPESPEDCRLKAEIDLVEMIGTETLVHFKVDAPVVVTEDMKELAADAGEDQVERLEERAREGTTEFVAQLDPKTRIGQGETAVLNVDTSRMHFFDPETSRGIYDNE
ncbi:MAG TPA: sn-glycerol-3-phosphate ABC transporter ATP-binding protein UgpC [Actinomycetota bacterium]|nr:sn-glycerol-3-phosphate ABC transporter ATP-binding protein UgpC [Actinomycetota bacterium]